MPFLSNYLFFLVFSILAGFFDWIVFNFISVFVPTLQSRESDAVYHIFWDLLGFPSALLATYFLLVTLLGILQIKLHRRAAQIMGASFIVVCLLSVLLVILRLRAVETSLGTFLFVLFLFGLPGLQAAVLLWSFGSSRRATEGAGTLTRTLILYFSIGYAVWYVLSYTPSVVHPSYHISILWYYLMLVPPTIALQRHLEGQRTAEVLSEITREGMAPFFQKHDLTEREKDVLLLLLKGKSYKMMEGELFVSMQTVKNYVSRIYKKLNVRNRVELMNLIRNTARDENAQIGV
jgi:DNA-binding CsgD family transcriptional regulator